MNGFGSADSSFSVHFLKNGQVVNRFEREKNLTAWKDAGLFRRSFLAGVRPRLVKCR